MPANLENSAVATRLEKASFHSNLKERQSQRIARRHKKAFLSDQCKGIKENNRMGKTRDLFKKIRDTKGMFHAKMDPIKDRNGRDSTEADGNPLQYSCLENPMDRGAW